MEEKLPQADIVHDRFHISQHLNEAVDKVCRQIKRSDWRILDEFSYLLIQVLSP